MTFVFICNIFFVYLLLINTIIVILINNVIIRLCLILDLVQLDLSSTLREKCLVFVTFFCMIK